MLYNTAESTILDKLLLSIGDKKIVSIRVIAPFYDAEGDALSALNKQLVPKEMLCILDLERQSAPYSLLKTNTSIVFCKADSPNPLHAKIFEVQAEDETWLLCGSANAGNMALGTGHYAFNDEVCILLHCNSQRNYIAELGLKYTALTQEEKKSIIAKANEMDGRRQEMESRLMRSWMFDNITIYRTSYLRDNRIRHYDIPGFGSQDDAFRFLSIANSRPSVSASVQYNRQLDLQNKITDVRAVTDICDEFRFLERELKKDKKLWWRMRLVFWQAYYDRNMLFYEMLAPELREKLSKRMQADIKGAISRKEYNMDHFDITVRSEMELLMRSVEEFDNFQKEKIRKREQSCERSDDENGEQTGFIEDIF